MYESFRIKIYIGIFKTNRCKLVNIIWYNKNIYFHLIININKIKYINKKINRPYIENLLLRATREYKLKHG